MKLLTASLTFILRVAHLVILPHHQSVLTIVMQIGLKVIPEVWHLTALKPAIPMVIALRRLLSAMMIQKMAGCLICFGTFAPFESTDIYHSKLLFTTLKVHLWSLYCNGD